MAHEGFPLRVGMEEGAEGQFRLLQIQIVLPQLLNGAVEGFAHIFMNFEFPQFLTKSSGVVARPSRQEMLPMWHNAVD